MHDFERNALISSMSLSKKLEHSDEIANQRQTDRHTHTQLDKQTDRHTDKHEYSIVAVDKPQL